MQARNIFKIYLSLLLIFGAFVFSDGYYVRMVYESIRDNVSVRYEEVYEQGDIKIVFVTAKDKFTWLKMGDKYYVGNGKTSTELFL